LFVLGIIAAFGWWLSEQIAPTRQVTQSTSQTLPDYSMSDFTLTSMDLQGIPEYTLQASSMVHYPEQEISDLMKPNLEFFQANAKPWNIRSETGKATDDGTLVNLLGKVRIWRQPSDTERAITMDTRNLTVQPDKDYAETHEAVHIVTEGHDIKGKGLRAYFDTEYFELLSDVRGTHEFNK
jgi:lipopolysaccharide export system protein LptC